MFPIPNDVDLFSLHPCVLISGVAQMALYINQLENRTHSKTHKKCEILPERFTIITKG